MSHIICLNSFHRTRGLTYAWILSNNYKKLYFATLNQESSDTWEVMRFTLLAQETVAWLDKQEDGCVLILYVQ